MRKYPILLPAALLAGCVSGPSAVPTQSPRPAAPPPMTGPVAAPTAPGFIQPKIMRMPGLESVIGADRRRLGELFGEPRLSVREGDALKLQFSGEACVLDIYLYPLRPGGEQTATSVEARRSSDGQDVDRAACVRALRQ